jgi:hypothetical protein
MTTIASALVSEETGKKEEKEIGKTVIIFRPILRN